MTESLVKPKLDSSQVTFTFSLATFACHQVSAITAKASLLIWMIFLTPGILNASLESKELIFVPKTGAEIYIAFNMPGNCTSTA